MGWDYKAGLVVGISDRIGYLNSGAVDGPKLLAGITNGTLNPFGLQDAAGKAYPIVLVSMVKNPCFEEYRLHGCGIDFEQSRHEIASWRFGDGCWF